MTRLYQSTLHPNRWIACVDGVWSIFPAREHGWEERKPARGLDPMFLREVPLTLASSTGLTASPEALEIVEAA